MGLILSFLEGDALPCSALAKVCHKNKAVREKNDYGMQFAEIFTCAPVDINEFTKL
jgi:hypothetical protein